MNKIGIFEAKTKLSELCLQVDKHGASYLITRRGRPIARLVGVGQEAGSGRTSLVSRMESTDRLLGAIPEGEPDFPDVWLDREGSKESPLDGE